MHRSLVLRRDALADLTPDDLTVVGGGPDRTLPCATDNCIDAIKSPSEIVAAIVKTGCNCPWSAGC